MMTSTLNLSDGEGFPENVFVAQLKDEPSEYLIESFVDSCGILCFTDHKAVLDYFKRKKSKGLNPRMYTVSEVSIESLKVFAKSEGQELTEGTASKISVNCLLLYDLSNRKDFSVYWLP